MGEIRQVQWWQLLCIIEASSGGPGGRIDGTQALVGWGSQDGTRALTKV